jgi:hypothetical protein
VPSFTHLRDSEFGWLRMAGRIRISCANLRLFRLAFEIEKQFRDAFYLVISQPAGRCVLCRVIIDSIFFQIIWLHMHAKYRYRRTSHLIFQIHNVQCKLLYICRSPKKKSYVQPTPTTINQPTTKVRIFSIKSCFSYGFTMKESIPICDAKS